MARRAGPFFSALRQRAASHISAVESGPPDTASTSAFADPRSANRALASSLERVVTASRGIEVRTCLEVFGFSLAVDALDFLLDAALHVGSGLRVFAVDLAEGRAGRFLLLHGGERLAKAQQRVRSLLRLVVL